MVDSIQAADRVCLQTTYNRLQTVTRKTGNRQAAGRSVQRTALRDQADIKITGEQAESLQIESRQIDDRRQTIYTQPRENI